MSHSGLQPYILSTSGPDWRSVSPPKAWLFRVFPGRHRSVCLYTCVCGAEGMFQWKSVVSLFKLHCQYGDYGLLFFKISSFCLPVSTPLPGNTDPSLSHNSCTGRGSTNLDNVHWWFLINHHLQLFSEPLLPKKKETKMPKCAYADHLRLPVTTSQ